MTNLITSLPVPIERRLIRRILLGMLLTVNICVIGHAQIPLLIRLNNPQQQIVVMGADMERSAGALQFAKNKEEIIRWVFDGTEGVDYLRVSFNKRQELERGKKNLETYDRQIASMQQIKAVRPDIRFWATPITDFGGYHKSNNLPDWIYTGDGYNGGKYDPDKLEVGLYAIFLADYLQLMHEKGVSIFGLSPTKEWSQVITSKKASQVIRLVKKECSKRKVPMPVIIGPASWSVTGGLNDLRQIQKLGDEKLYAAFCTHTYNKSGTEQNVRKFVELAAKMGKRTFIDESGFGATSPTSGKEPPFKKALSNFFARSSFYRAGLAGEVCFENWSRGINSETRSIYFRKGGKGRRLRPHYIFLEFAAATMKAWYVPSLFKSPQKDLETMVFWKGKQLTIWVMNQSEQQSKTLDIRLAGGKLSDTNFETVSWSKASDNIQGDRTKTEASSTIKLAVKVEPSSINVIHLQLKRKSR